MKGDKDLAEEYDAVSGEKLKSCHDSQDISSRSSNCNPSNFLSANSKNSNYMIQQIGVKNLNPNNQGHINDYNQHQAPIFKLNNLRSQNPQD